MVVVRKPTNTAKHCCASMAEHSTPMTTFRGPAGCSHIWPFSQPRSYVQNISPFKTWVVLQSYRGGGLFWAIHHHAFGLSGIYKIVQTVVGALCAFLCVLYSLSHFIQSSREGKEPGKHLQFLISNAGKFQCCLSL